MSRPARAFATAPWLGTEILERFGAGVLWGGALGCGLLSAGLLARMRATA